MRTVTFTFYLVLMAALSEVLFMLATITSFIVPKTYYFRWLLLETVARTRFRLGMLAGSRRLAKELLAQADHHQDDWNYGNAIHQANTLLGRIALRKGDIAAANKFLIASGRTPGSPQLCSFGPNMSLANELLQVGEVGTVLEYFRHCSSFWEKEFSSIGQWENDIRKGRSPRFGPNLYY